jgi:hypothetical protein
LTIRGAQLSRETVVGAVMPSYSELFELARMCWRQSHLAQDQGVARELRRMALEYQQEAAKLDSGKLPELDDCNDDKPRI